MASLKWWDFHCHPNEWGNVEKALSAARALGIQGVCANGTNALSNGQCRSLSHAFKGLVFFGLGMHPQELIQWSRLEQDHAWEGVQAHAADAHFFGETGLDYKYGVTVEQRECQAKWFACMTALARAHDKAVEVHSRQARSQTLEFLQRARAEKVLLHWFYGDKKMIRVIVENGWKASVGPSVLTQPHIQSFARALPVENLCLETDGPVSFDGVPADSTWIPRVAEKVCALKGLSMEELSHVQQRIARDYFGFKP